MPATGVSTTSGRAGTRPSPRAESTAAARGWLPWHDLVHPLGEHQVGDGVDGVGQPVDRAQDRLQRWAGGARA